MIKKIFSPVILITSILLIIYVFYKSQIYWEGKKNDYYIIYYVISIFLLVFSIFSFFISYKVKEYLFIILSTVIFSLYIFEFYTFNQTNKEKNLDTKIKLYKKQTGNEYDTRSVKEVYDHLKKTKLNVAVKVPPTEYLNIKKTNIYPLSGVSNSKTVYGNENGYYMIYLSDRFGFNNPDTEWDSNEVEYLIVGDSFAHGAAVNRPDEIASKLRIFSSKSVINIGYSANGPLIEYAALKEFMPKNVNKVVWLFTDNDVEGFNYEYKNEILRKYFNDKNFSQNLKKKQSQVDKIAKQMIYDVRAEKLKFNFYKHLKLYNTRQLLIGKKNKKKNSVQKELIKVLEMARDYSYKQGAEFYLVYLPLDRYFNEDHNNIIYREIISISKNLKIPLIDIHAEVFKKEKTPLKLFPFGFIGHYNVEGYRKTAKAIFDETSDK